MAVKSFDPEPLETEYVRYIKFHLQHQGAWPHQEFGEKGSHKLAKIKQIFFFITSSLVLIQILTILKECREKLPSHIMGQCYLDIAILCTAIQRHTIPLDSKFAQYLKKLLKEMHMYYFRHKSDYAMEIFKKVNHICKLATMIMYLQLYLGVMIAMSGDIYQNYKNGLFTTDPSSLNTTVFIESPLCIYIPFTYSHMMYAFSTIVIIYLLILISMPIITFDLILFLSLGTLWGHIRIFKHEIATFPRPRMEQDGLSSMWNPAWYNEEESLMVRKRLVAMIDHHRLMKEFSEASSDMYGMMLLFYYFVLQISQIIVLLHISHLTFSSFCKFGELALLTFQLLTTVSIALELIASESETLWTAVYDLPWECMDASNRRLVFFFMNNTQKSMGFKAKDLLDVGVKTAVSIIKTSCSCYLFLRSLQ